MGSRLVLVMVAAVAIVAVGGIGFAAFTSSVTVNGTASAGNIVLEFASNPYGTGASTPSGATCTLQTYGGTTTTISISASNLAPNQYCSFVLTITNAGSLPANSESSLFTASSGSYCSSSGEINCIWVQDSLSPSPLNSETGVYTGSGTTVIPAGGTLTYTIYTTLPAGSTDQSTSLGFSISLTGSS
jgi:hypothetical protein